jgi:hypothetical protein
VETAQREAAVKGGRRRNRGRAAALQGRFRAGGDLERTARGAVGSAGGGVTEEEGGGGGAKETRAAAAEGSRPVGGA